MKGLALVLVTGLAVGAAAPAVAGTVSAISDADTCITQSQMKDADRNALKAAAEAFAAKIQANDSAGVKALTISDYQKDFGGMQDAIVTVAPRLKGAAIQVDQLYVLDASTSTKAADSQFFCSLNQTANEAQFVIPQLPPGKYAFAMVRMESATPWRISLLMQQNAGQWMLAGLYPRELTAGGHDGLWYWTQSRTLTAKEPWNAWLYLQQAQALLLPVNFIGSTHLEKLQTELGAVAPPAVSGGLSADTPLVVKGADGTEFRFTAITVDDSLHADKVDVAAHIKVDALGDNAAARKRNSDAAAALVAAHPEMRKNFHGVWIFTDAPGQGAFATEMGMAEIR